MAGLGTESHGDRLVPGYIKVADKAPVHVCPHRTTVGLVRELQLAVLVLVLRQELTVLVVPFIRHGPEPLVAHDREAIVTW